MRGGISWPPQWHLHLLRGALIALATLLFFSSLTRLPVADALAIFFVEPLILTLLAPIFLGEKTGWRRLSAVAVGFCGALLIIRPGAASFGWIVLLPMAAACCFAGYLILTRKFATRMAPVPIQFYTGVAGLVVMTAALLFGHMADSGFLAITTPDLSQWIKMAALGTVGCAGHLLVVYAFSYLDASVLAPFQYLEIVSAAILGWLFFGELPAIQTWTGILIIVGAGIYIYWREQTLKRG